MTENPNTQPEPNAGRPTTPGSAPVEPAGGAQAAGSTGAAGSAEPTGAGEAAGAGGSTVAGASTGSSAAAEAEPPVTQEPVTQEPATGGVAETPLAAHGEEAGEFAEPAGPAGPAAPNTGVAATFLPGIDAASILALVLAALGAGAFLLVNPLVQAHDAARTWSDFKNNVPRTRQDPFGLQRDWVNYQSWAHIILGLVAVLLALLVLAMWTAQRHQLRSRSFAQAALVLGLAVVLYGILLKTGAVGSEIPSMKDISAGLSSSSSQ